MDKQADVQTQQSDRTGRAVAYMEEHYMEAGPNMGYLDEHVFMRRFKKYTDKTPKQYRDSKQG